VVNGEIKVNDIYKFLEKNHGWNNSLQIFWNKRTLSHCTSSRGRLRALLHSVVQTQSKPNIEKLMHFWKAFEEYKWARGLISIIDLNNFLQLQLEKDGTLELKFDDVADAPLSQLFQLLKLQSGWGPKTSALFVKNVIRVHRASEAELHFLNDSLDLVGKVALKREKRLYVPVDKVIIHIFQTHVQNNTKTFDSINHYLSTSFDCEQMLIWDDLWLWGFITQNSKSQRVTAWNPAKFWSLQFHTKKEEEIKCLAEKFIRIIHS
jgi:hypothetical protein